MATPNLTPEQEALKKRVCEAWSSFEDGLGKELRPRWEELYRMYRTHRDLGRHLSQLPGLDQRVSELEDQWGSDLRIPYAFSTVETIVARQLSNNPEMLYLPRDQTAMVNVSNMARTIEAQQEQIRYPLVCQTTAKTGQIYGIGFQKAMWRVEQGKANLLTPATGLNPFEWAQESWTGRAFDDPDAFDVDPFDMAWDPYADGVENCEWMIHRTWRSHRYVMGRIKQAQQAEAQFAMASAEAIANGEPQPSQEPKGWYMAAGLSEEDVRAMGSGEKYTEVWAERMSARGHANFDRRGQQLHEVWEFHDGEKVITVLDREVPVCVYENPLGFGELPFHIYRPVEVPHEFVGIGAIEPAKDLFYEVDLLRSSRRDSETLAMTPVFAYREGVIDPSAMQVYPGAVWPVTGEPKDLLQRVDLGGVDQSGYQAEDRVKADIERVTGLGDVVLGAAQTGGGTATEAQLQLASANVRIQAMGRRFEVEMIEGVCQQWLDMNQQHITESRGYAREVPAPGRPERRWTWFDVGPKELAGQMWAKCVGGTEAQNVPQMRSDAQMKAQMMGGRPEFDQRVVAASIAKDLGFTNPDMVLAPDNAVPPETLDIAAQAIAERIAAQNGNGEGGPGTEQIVQDVRGILEQARGMAVQQAQQGGEEQ